MADVTFDRLKPSGKFRRLIEDMPSDMRDSFTEAQREALGEAMSSRTWRRQSVDIRLSLPILSQRYFMTVVAGRDGDRACGARRRGSFILSAPLATRFSSAPSPRLCARC